MPVQLTALPVTAAQKLFAVGYPLLAGSTPSPAPSSSNTGGLTGCELADASRKFGDTLALEIKNAFPVYVYWGFLAAAVLTLVLGATGRLGSVGKLFGAIVFACLLFGAAGTLANIFAPATCH